MCTILPSEAGSRPCDADRPTSPVAVDRHCLYPTGQPGTFTMPLIYKICPRALWQEAREAGRFAGAPIDLADGFIHFSTAAQVAETAARHFAGQADLLLLAVEADALGDALRYEASRGGDLFPHLYGDLPLSAVVDVEELPLGPEGGHVFPEGIPPR